MSHFSSRAPSRDQLNAWVHYHEVHYFETNAATRALRHLLAVWAVVFAAFCAFLVITALTASPAKAQTLSLPILVAPVNVAQENNDHQELGKNFVPHHVLHHPDIAQKCTKPVHQRDVTHIQNYRLCVQQTTLQQLSRL